MDVRGVLEVGKFSFLRGELVNRQPNDRPSPTGIGLTWASRIFAISAEMVLPGIAGQWLDARLGTRFLVLIGFALGISLAIWHLLVMTKPKPRGFAGQDRRQTNDGEES